MYLQIIPILTQTQITFFVTPHSAVPQAPSALSACSCDWKRQPQPWSAPSVSGAHTPIRSFISTHGTQSVAPPDPDSRAKIPCKSGKHLHAVVHTLNICQIKRMHRRLSGSLSAMGAHARNTLTRSKHILVAPSLARPPCEPLSSHCVHPNPNLASSRSQLKRGHMSPRKTSLACDVPRSADRLDRS